MFATYFRSAIRNLLKHRFPAVTNIIGLAVGIACCILLFLYVSHETSFDEFHSDSDRIYRVTYHATEPSGNEVHRAQTPPLLVEALENGFAAVEAGVRVGRNPLRVASDVIMDERREVDFADPSVFDVFSFALGRGSETHALADPGNVVLSPEAADRYFPNVDPMGKTLTIGMKTGDAEYTVAGILAAIPSNSSIRFDVLLPFSEYRKSYSAFLRDAVFDSWSMPLPVVDSYVRLTDETDANAVETGLPDLVRTNWGDDEIGRRLELQPLEQIHLDTRITNGLEPTGNPMYAWLLGAGALLILLIACINYVTMSLARCVERAREVGVRKVVGAAPEQVRNQFWGEALLVTLLAFLVGTMLAEIALPTFNSLSGKSLELDLLRRTDFWVIAAGAIVLISMTAGLYPAVILSRFQPAHVLKGLAGGSDRRLFSRVLITVQFTISIALVAGLIAVDRQLEFLTEADLGFDPERVVVLRTSGTDYTDSLLEGLRNLTDSHPDVQSMTGAFFSFGTPGFDLELTTGSGEDVIPVRMNPVSDNYVEAMGLTLLEGRSFQPGSGEKAVLVNRALVRRMAWDTAVGRVLPVHEEATFGGLVRDMTIIGVVEDFHLVSMHEAIEPLVLPSASAISSDVMAVSMRIRAGSESDVIPELQSTWERLAPDRPFRYEFLQDVVESQYREEDRWRSILAWAGGIAVILACFGLVGLALMSTQRRTREIGIRKVLGATTFSLVSLLSREYALQVAVASLISVPLAWYGTEQWLSGFAYRVDLGAGVYLAAGAAVLVIALVATSLQIVRTALADPVDSLRTE